jgi:hypothetical protein
MAVAVLAPVRLAPSVAVSGSWTVIISGGWTALAALVALAWAATLATYLRTPGTGLRLEFGCVPCTAVAVVGVPASLAVPSSASHDVPTVISALGVAALG